MKTIAHLLVLALSVFVAVSVQAGVAFPDPAGGWTYIFNGDKDTYGGPGSGFTSLDGTWSFENGSSQWDGSKIGGVLGPDNAPGGVMSLTESNVTFLRIQDPGNPTGYGYSDPSNRKIYFGHNITEEKASDTIIDDGVTLSFRARLPTTPPIDELYPDGQAANGPQPYPASGDGGLDNNSGKGGFVIYQNAGGEIAFSLTTTNDTSGGDPTGTKAGFAGLTMNALNGNQVTANVDFGQGTVTNQIPLDPRQWHEFWIVLRKDAANTGTHEAFIFVDGNPNGYSFKMTAGNGSDYTGLSYLAMGSPQTSQSSAQDVDFFAYKIGAVFPPGVTLQVGSASANAYGVSITVSDSGPSVADTNSIVLKLDGAAVKPTSVTKKGSTTTIAYTTTNLLASASTHTVSLTIKDTLSPPNVVSVDRQVSVTPYATIPDSFALTAAQVDTTKPGFIWQMSQVDSVGADTQNSTQRTLDQLAGLLGPNTADPSAQGVALAPGKPGPTPNDPISFEIPGVLELDRNGAAWGTWGNQASGDQMPGSPGTGGGTDNQAARVVTYVDLPAGLITMGVNSDDGFLTEAGSYNDAFAPLISLGEFNGGRGSADTLFTFLITKAGIYPLVTYWENGGGDSRIAWFSVKADGTQVALNDAANGGLKSYRALVGGTKAVALSVVPAPNATNALPNNIQVQLADGASPIDKSTVSLKLDNTTVAATITKTGNVTTVAYVPSPALAPLSTHTAALIYTEGGSQVTRSWQFAVMNYPTTPPKVVLAANASGGPFLDLVFDRLLDPATATNTANYKVSGGNVTSARLAPISNADHHTVLLQVSAVASANATVTVNGVKDFVGNALSSLAVPIRAPLYAVNFQTGPTPSSSTPDAPTPAGYQPDIGLAYGTRGGGLTYGWDVDNQAPARYRQNASSPDLRYDTFIHMGKPLPAGRVWEIAVTNGTYDVYLIAGESDNEDEYLNIDVEGILAVSSTAYQPTAAPWKEGLVTVNVKDGKLTVSNDPTYNSDPTVENNKIDFIEIFPSTAPPVTTTPKLAISLAAGKVTLTFDGTLQGADMVTGPWNDIAGASPQTVPASGTMKFYRAKQ